MIKIHHDKKLFWWIIALLIILVGVLVLIQVQEAKKKLNETETEKIIECDQDSDCINRQVTCCPCNAGGREMCVPKNNETYENARKGCPPESVLVCPQSYNCKQSACSCVNNKCVEV